MRDVTARTAATAGNESTATNERICPHCGRPLVRATDRGLRPMPSRQYDSVTSNGSSRIRAWAVYPMW
jgi:hypothetical protein